MRRVQGPLLFVAALIAALVVLPWVFQRRLIYFPSTAPPPPAAQLLADAEDVAFETADGLRLEAWFVRGDGAAAPTVLVLNGNAGDRSLRSGLAETFRAAAAANVLLTDYRGYAGNPGRPTETGLLEDARAARAWLATRDDVDPERLVYFGESLGSGVAVALAAEQPPAALVLRSPFTSLADVGRLHFPLLPVRTMLKDRFPSIERIGSVGCPVLIVAGDRDTIVPVGLSRRLFEAAGEPREWVVVEGADHNDAALTDGDAWGAELRAFLRRHGV